MTAIELVEAVEKAGGSLRLKGDRLQYELPREAVQLLPKLRDKRNEVMSLLQKRAIPPNMPTGIELVRWQPKNPPVIVARHSVVTDVASFASATLAQIEAALVGRQWQAGNWSIRELIDRLEQVGVEVRLHHIVV